MCMVHLPCSPLLMVPHTLPGARPTWAGSCPLWGPNRTGQTEPSPTVAWHMTCKRGLWRSGNIWNEKFWFLSWSMNICYSQLWVTIFWQFTKRFNVPMYHTGIWISSSGQTVQFLFGFGRKFRPVSVSVSVFWFSPFSAFRPKYLISADFGCTFQYKVNCQNSILWPK